MAWLADGPPPSARQPDPDGPHALADVTRLPRAHGRATGLHAGDPADRGGRPVPGVLDHALVAGCRAGLAGAAFPADLRVAVWRVAGGLGRPAQAADGRRDAARADGRWAGD